MKFKQYFFVFFGLMINHQIIFSSGHFLPNVHKLTSFFQAGMNFLSGHQDPSIDVEKCIQFMSIHTQLYNRYKVLLPGLDNVTYSNVFNSFVDEKKEDEIYTALNQDIDCIQSAFGKKIQDIVLGVKTLTETLDQPSLNVSIHDADVLKLYEFYQEKIGSFDKSLFDEVFNCFASINKMHLFVDACKQDTVKIESVFGRKLKQLVLISRHREVLRKLETTFSLYPNIAPVCQKILQNIETENLLVNPLFFPKLTYLGFEKYFHDLNNKILSIDDKVSLIARYCERLTKIFVEFIPKDVEDCIDCQKHIDSFITVLPEYEKNNDLFKGHPRTVANTFKNLQNKNHQLQPKFLEAKKTISKDQMPSVLVEKLLTTPDFEKELERCVQLEMNRRIPIINAQALSFVQIETDQLASFKEAQQKEKTTLIDQQNIGLMQIKNEERDSIFNTFLAFLEGCRSVAATRLDEIKNKRFVHAVVGFHQQRQDTLIDESASKLAELKKQELLIESLSLEMNKETAQRALIDQLQQSTFQEFGSVKKSSLQDVQFKEKVRFVENVNAVVSQHCKDEQKSVHSVFVDFAQGCHAILAYHIRMTSLRFLDEKKREMLNIESANTFKRLKNQESEEKPLSYQVQPWIHNPYGSSVIPVEVLRKELLHVLMSIQAEEKDLGLTSASDDKWYVAGNYRWRSLPNDSYECEHNISKMVGRIDGSGLASVKVGDNRWVSLNW